jgi:ferredoxin-NADP reductase
MNIVYSSPGDSDLRGRENLHEGHVGRQTVVPYATARGHPLYVWGSLAIIQALMPWMAEQGVQVGDIHYEAFGPASIKLPGTPELPPTVVAEVKVRLQRSGGSLI